MPDQVNSGTNKFRHLNNKDDQGSTIFNGYHGFDGFLQIDKKDPNGDREKRHRPGNSASGPVGRGLRGFHS
jgi:hypothetical protein